jgi:hypothetical protein
MNKLSPDNAYSEGRLAERCARAEMEIERLRASNAALGGALEGLYETFSGSNDFRPDSRIARQARAAIAAAKEGAMTEITFPLNATNVAQCMAERDTEIERLRALEFATRDENERLRAINKDLLEALEAMLGYLPAAENLGFAERITKAQAAVFAARGKT